MRRQQVGYDLWAVVVIAVAVVLRTIHLGAIPSALEYDEAANVILAGEIARGQAHPIFIRAYTGKEVLYFYLAAGIMKLAGVTPFALRLASVVSGVLAVALTYWCTREMLAVGGLQDRDRRWLALLSAALVTVSYWQVNLSRFGYRAILLPAFLALTIGSLLRALRTGRWVWFLLAGGAAGLSAYTYSSVRAFPFLLLAAWIWILISDRRRWPVHLPQLLLFGLVALLAFSPLGLFFLRNPETFSVRLDQVSVFSPSVHQGDSWGTFQETALLAIGMFTHAGDMNPLYNSPGKPVFDLVLGAFFYLGLIVCAWRTLGPSKALARPGPDAGVYPHLPYFLLLAWLLIMMVPNVLSARGVPHNLRAMALVPAVYIVAALGIYVAAQWLADAVDHLRGRGRARGALLAGVLLALLFVEAALTYREYVYRWAPSAAPYYKGNQALLDAADLLNAHPQADPYVATYFHQHATLAVAARQYQRIRWLSGSTLVLPPAGAPPALLIYDHTNPVDPLLRERYLLADTLLQQQRGPDGAVAYEAFWLDDTSRPAPAPQHPMQVNLGHTLRLLGYDLNAHPHSAEELDVSLYFQVLQPADRDDYAFFAHLVDDLGFHWGGDTFFEYPSAQWRPGEVLIMRRQLPIAPGAPPGEYTLDVGAFSSSLDARLPVLNEEGQMRGTVASIGPLEVARATNPPADRPPIQRPQVASWDDRLTFLGSDRDRSDLRPGETLALTLHWQASPAVYEPYAVSVWLHGEQGDVPLWHGDPVHGLYPFTEWAADEYVRDRYALRLPLEVLAGDYDLRVALLDEHGLPMPVAEGTNASRYGRWLSLGTIHVHATDRVWEPPPFEHPVGARLGSQVELVGYDLDSDTVRPGEALHLTLVWRSHEAMDTAYTVFTHLLDAGEQLKGQKDNPPVGGTYPTTLWVPGEVVVDAYEIPVAPDAVPGEYVVEVGMYDPATMERLPVHDPTGTIGSRVLLANVQVVSAE